MLLIYRVRRELGKSDWDMPRDNGKRWTRESKWLHQILFPLKVKKNKSVSCSIMSSSLRPHGLYPPPSLLCPWNSPGKNTKVGSIPFSRGSFQPRYPALPADSLLSEPLGKPTSSLLTMSYHTKEEIFTGMHPWIWFQGCRNIYIWKTSTYAWILT